jgi:hypothetical protein
MLLMDLDEQADKDFGRARQRAWLGRVAARLRGGTSPRDAPPSFDQLRRSLRAYNRVRRVTRVVELEKIVGSVGRRRDFDRSFMPLRASARERWKRVDLDFHRGEDLPPVILYKLGDAYFVLDGNHRVSVARFHGLPSVEAEVMEFRPTDAANRDPACPAEPRTARAA